MTTLAARSSTQDVLGHELLPVTRPEWAVDTFPEDPEQRTDRSLTADLDILDRRTELTLRTDRLSQQLSRLESAARAARPKSVLVFGWPSFSMDTGLTEAQEYFVSEWSPKDVMDMCAGQRQLIDLLESWLATHDDSDDLALALALISTCSKSVPR